MSHPELVGSVTLSASVTEGTPSEVLSGMADRVAAEGAAGESAPDEEQASQFHPANPVSALLQTMETHCGHPGKKRPGHAQIERETMRN